MSGSPYPTQLATAPTPSADVTINVGGMALSGWEKVTVTRGCERLPASFELAVTERYPSQPTQIVIQPGAPCTVMIGQASIIVGYVDRYEASVTPTTHTVAVTGRSKCRDLVDCSAVVPNSAVGSCTPMSLAQSLAKPFGISVSGDAETPQLPQINIALGETPAEIIARVARYAVRLVYDDVDGNLVLAKVGTARHASGFAEGVNCQSWNVTYSSDDRYSEYISVLFSMQTMQELGNSGNLLGIAKDPGVSTYRPLIIVSEQFILGQSVALQRAQWEAQRRRGRSQALRVVCDSWFDSAGTLWTPNTLAAVSFPSVKLQAGAMWIVSEVTYNLDPEGGTFAEVTLMPPEAFTVEPTDLQAYDYQVEQAMQSLGGAAPSGTAQ